MNMLIIVTITIAITSHIVIVSFFSHKATQEVMSAMDINPLTETTDFEAVRDNRDCTVMLSWDPPSRLS